MTFRPTSTPARVPSADLITLRRPIWITASWAAGLVTPSVTPSNRASIRSLPQVRANLTRYPPHLLTHPPLLPPCCFSALIFSLKKLCNRICVAGNHTEFPGIILMIIKLVEVRVNVLCIFGINHVFNFVLRHIPFYLEIHVSIS